MIKIGMNKLRDLTSISLPTLRKLLANIPYEDGPRGAKLFDSTVVLAEIYGKGGGAGGSGYDYERTRLTKAQADLTELNVSEKDGTLLDSELVNEMLLGKVMSARAGLLSLPSRIAPVVMSATTIREVEDFAREIVYQVLNDLADGITEDQSGGDGGIPPSSKTDNKRMGARAQIFKPRSIGGAW